MKQITVVQGPKSQTGMWVVIVFVVMFSLLLFQEDSTLLGHLFKTIFGLFGKAPQADTSGRMQNAPAEEKPSKQESLKKGLLERPPASTTYRLKPSAFTEEQRKAMCLSVNEPLPRNAASKGKKKKQWHPER